MPNKIIPYNPRLKLLARELRKNSTYSEVLLWNKIRRRALGVQFHRQVPMLNYIVDFYCHEIGLIIEIDGSIHNNQFLEDAKRQNDLENYGLHFLRFPNDLINNQMQMVLKKIELKIKELL